MLGTIFQCIQFSANQLVRMYEQKRYAREIKEAMDLVRSHQVGYSFAVNLTENGFVSHTTCYFIFISCIERGR